MKIAFVGDPHNNWENIPQHLDYPVVALGDMSMGIDLHIIGKGIVPDPESFGPRFRFIRGNHDKPSACREHPQYLGDYGFAPDLGVFFVSGAFSHDKPKGIPGGMGWYEDEELTIEELNDAVDLYSRFRPRVMISHEGPYSAVKEMRHTYVIPNRTSQALERMLEIHRPEKWIFGHHHRHLGQYIDGTHFICLDICEVLHLEFEK